MVSECVEPHRTDGTVMTVTNKKIRGRIVYAKDKNNKLYVFDSVADAVERTGAFQGSIYKCCNGKREGHHGYNWSYYPFPVSESDEKWKDIIGYESIYQISNFGNIRSSYRGTWKIISPGIDKHGYRHVMLHKNKIKKNFKCNRLVAMAFLPNPMCLPCVNHKDENPLNDHVDNLEWCSYKYNANYGTRNEKIKKAQGIKVYCFDLEGNKIKEFDCSKDAALFVGVTRANISLCCEGKRASCRGLLFSYKDEEKTIQDMISRANKKHLKNDFDDNFTVL